jgi:4-hydroxyphenylpyruvate dioxygenase-like putative hemolysin
MKKKVETPTNITKIPMVNKIFNIIEVDDNLYFIDQDLKLIWNTNTDVVGIVNNNNCVFFDYIDKIIENIKQENNIIII